MDIVPLNIIMVPSHGRRSDGFFHLSDFCAYSLIRSPVSRRLMWFFQLSLFNYTVDAYIFAAASALAANTVCRSIFGAVFPVRVFSTCSLAPLYSPPFQLFARQMFESLNPRWASTLLGIFAAVMIPIPIILRRYGPYLRSKSRFVPSVAPTKPQNSLV